MIAGPRLRSRRLLQGGVGHLRKLNAERRGAIQHGFDADDCEIAGALLVIAGAGSGKINTLAHQAAHLSVAGASAAR